MSQKIESEKMFVKEVFTNWYRIPEYQRPYVWETDQVIELLDDVYQAYQSNPDSEYFLGSMVLQKKEKKEKDTTYYEYDLLDGQQRLTTLFLITAIVRDLTPPTNQARVKVCTDAIFQMEVPDYNIPERIRILFDIRKCVKEFVDEYVKTGGGTQEIDKLIKLTQDKDVDISIRNMANAMLTINQYFSNGHSIDGFFKYLSSNVLMIYVAAEELEDAFHLFTVMNNRGIKLRNSDILKAENLAVIVDENLRVEYAKLWESIELYFAEDFDNFLSHLRTILVKQKAGYNLLREFEENIYAPKEYNQSTKEYKNKPPLLTKGKPTFEYVKRYYNNYVSLFDKDNYDANKGFDIYNQLTLMQKGFEADYWIAPVLRYYDKYQTTDLLEFLVLLETKFSSEWIIGLSPTKRIESINIIIKAIEDTQDTKSLQKSKVFSFETIDLIRTLCGGIYGRKYAKYLLLKIDLSYLGNTTKFNPPETISIEHILPQNPETTSQWCTDYSDDDREKWTNRLGNLILLSRRKNTAQSNYDYSRKRDKYFKGNIELFSNSVRIMKDYPTWELKDLKKNHEEMLVRTLGFYGITLTDDQLRDALQ